MPNLHRSTVRREQSSPLWKYLNQEQNPESFMCEEKVIQIKSKFVNNWSLIIKYNKKEKS